MQHNCDLIPFKAIYGTAEVVPLHGDDEVIPLLAGPDNCELSIRDNFAMSALIALGSDDTYALARSKDRMTIAVEDAYFIADLMVTKRQS